MLDMYLDTLIINQTVCSMLSILTELTYQKYMQDFLTKMFLTKE